jgi:branched-chain amino acid transport system ATP-binding protein
MLHLEVDNVSVAYDGMVALQKISVQVHEGEIVGLIGANGAGKSTLLNTISGLLKPTEGQINFNDVDIQKLPPHKIVELGIVQIPEGRRLFPLLSVEENLFIGSYIPRARKVRKESLEKVYGILPRLKQRRNQLTKTLSGGEQQMVAIGRALMTQPRLLLMDELTLGLAPTIVSDIYDLIGTIHEQGITILLVEQNVRKTLNIATRALVLENGRIILEGKGVELMNNEHVKKAFLGI